MMFSDRQKEFMQGLGIARNDYVFSDDDLAEIEDIVGQHYTKIMNGSRDIAQIEMCESILDAL